MFQQFFGYMDVEMTMLKCMCGEQVWFMPKTAEDITGNVCAKCGATFQQRYDYWKEDYAKRYEAWQKEQREQQAEETTPQNEEVENTEVAETCSGEEQE